MADKIKLNIIEGVEKEGKKGKYFIYTNEMGTKYLSKDEFKEGENEVFLTIQKGEFDGKPTSTNWIAKEEYKPKQGGGKQFYPKQPDQVSMLKEAMVMVADDINLGITPKPKTRDERRALVLSEFEWVKGIIK